jgi:CheY-like chemotaxis protein
LSFLLQSEGFSVSTARTAPEGLQKAGEDLPDLVLMDVMMSDMNGYEACRALKSEPRTSGIPVVLISAKGQKAEQEEGKRAGAAAYVVKPFEPDTLLTLVKSTLGDGRVSVP